MSPRPKKAQGFQRNRPAGKRSISSRRREGDVGRPRRNTELQESRRTERDSRRHLGGEQVEGRRAVIELLSARRRHVGQVWIADSVEPSSEIDRITRLASASGVRVQIVGSRKLDAEARTRSHQGVLAKAAPLTEFDLAELCSPLDQKTPFLLVLDGITDPQNVGALLRTAECAGVTGVVLARHGAAHITPATTKSAAGAVEYLRIAVVAGIPSAIARITDAGLHCIGLDADASLSLFCDEPPWRDAGEGVALVLGDEGKGLGNLTKKRCTTLVSIPQVGAIDSLNVSAAGAIASFEVARSMGTERNMS